MFGIGVYVKDKELKDQIKDTIRDFLIERHLMAKVSYFENIEHLITTPNSFDLYILDMDAEDNMIQLGEEMTNIDLGTNIIYLGSTQDSLLKAAKNLIDYYLHKPFEPNELLILLSKIKQKIKAIENVCNHKVYAISAIAKQGVTDCLRDISQFVTRNMRKNDEQEPQDNVKKTWSPLD